MGRQMTTILRPATAKTKQRTTAPGAAVVLPAEGSGGFIEEHLGGQGRAAAGQGRGPKSAALRSMLAAGEDDEEDAMGWDDHNDYFEVDDGKNETEDNGAGAAAVLRFVPAGRKMFLLLCLLLCCVVLGRHAQCTMMTVASSTIVIFEYEKVAFRLARCW